MKIRDIVNNVIRTKKNEEWIEVQEIADQFEIFGLYSYHEDDMPLKAYWAAKHNCTDTWVGIRVYYFNSLPVAISIQSGRKSDENFEWLSEQAFKIVQDWLISLKVADENVQHTIADLDEDLGDGYKVYFTSQLLDDKVIYKGELLEVNTKARYELLETRYDSISQTVKIKTSNGEEIVVDIEDCLVPWKVNVPQSAKDGIAG